MSNRILRVNQLIKKELSKILLKEVDFSRDILVTITRVKTSVDLKVARVYISCLPEKYIKRVLRILNRQIFDLQQKINKRLKMRPIPRLKFIEEKETAEAGRIEKLLEELKKGKK